MQRIRVPLLSASLLTQVIVQVQHSGGCDISVVVWKRSTIWALVAADSLEAGQRWGGSPVCGVVLVRLDAMWVSPLSLCARVLSVLVGIQATHFN